MSKKKVKTFSLKAEDWKASEDRIVNVRFNIKVGQVWRNNPGKTHYSNYVVLAIRKSYIGEPIVYIQHIPEGSIKYELIGDLLSNYELDPEFEQP